MKRTIMSYMVATILSLTAVIGLAMQPTTQMAHAQTNTNQTPSTSQSASTNSVPTVTNPACGEVVQGNVNLTSDLNCTSDGLLVGSSNTVINLNGHTIAGPGPQSSKVGIVVPDYDNVAINGDGTIKGFQAGILVTGANNVQAKLIGLTANEIGMFLTGAKGVSMSQSTVWNNNLGVAAHSSNGASMTGNMLSGNTLAGLTLVNTVKSIIAGNNVEGGQNGLFLDAQSHDNTINMNNIMHNVIDLNNANGLAPNINVNSFADNNCIVSNPSGLCIGR